MKRSEMVKFITTELFYGSLSARVDSTGGMITELAEKDAEAVLKLVEKFGMLPPPDYTETYYSGDEPGGYNPNFWEEE
jgi:hypothetical protein